MHLTNSHPPQVLHYLRRGTLPCLNELTDLAKQRSLGKFERLASERCLQIMMDAAISISQHCCKKAGKIHSGNAYRNLLTTHDLLNSNIPHSTLKDAVGMRNAIVHHYLNLDWTRIETVLVNKHYEAIGEFIEEGLVYLDH